MVFPVGFLDGQVVDAGVSKLGQPSFIELPVLVSIGSKPISGIVVPFVRKPDGNAIVVKGPQFLYRPIIQLTPPLTS